MLDFLRMMPQYLVPQKLLSKSMGYLASQPRLQQMAIKWFIKHYQVDMSEAVKPNAGDYKTFNEFFIRHLKKELRPVDNSETSIISPVDGKISQMGELDAGRLIQAKGCLYSTSALFGDDAHRAEPFLAGNFMTLYLSPKDYHRIHFPLDATLKEMVYIPGNLFAVKPSAVLNIPNLFARNERLVIFFETAMGPVALVMVGAMIVASLATTWNGELKREDEKHFWKYPNVKCENVDFSKGDELGYFKLGSTVILLFANKDQMAFANGLSVGDTVKFGQPIASRLP